MRDDQEDRVQGLRRRHALLDQGGVSADEVDSDLAPGPVEGLGDPHEVLGASAGRSSDDGDGCDGDPLVDDGHPVFHAEFVADLHEVTGESDDLVVDLPAQGVQVGIDAVEEADPHRDRPDIQVLMGDHLVGLEDLSKLYHDLRSCASSRRCPRGSP